jgi:glutamate transport system substrate-binding protein
MESRIRRSRLVALAAAAALLASCQSGPAGNDPTLTSTNSVRIAINYWNPGMSYKDGQTFSGFDIDLATFVAGELGYAPESIVWVEAHPALRETLLTSGQADLVVATYSETKKRAEHVSFAGPYFIAGQDLLVASDSDITSPTHLDGRIVCVAAGSTSADRIVQEFRTELELITRNNYLDCAQALVDGDAAAMTSDDVILAGIAAQPQFVGKLRVVGSPFSLEQLSIGLPLDTPLCQDVTDAIATWIESGQWQKAFDKHIAASGYTPLNLNPPSQAPCGGAS